MIELPDKWLHDCGEDWGAFNCAKDLEAALPVWTRITEDESTWPEDGQNILYKTKRFIPPVGTTYRSNGKGMTPHYIVAWRPLCDLDTPPDELE